MPDFTALADPLLVEQARHDPEAFAALYRRYLTPIYGYIQRRVPNVHEAEDLTAQTFMEVLDGLKCDRYREGGTFRAWLFTIARRRLVDFYREHPSLELHDSPSGDLGPLVTLEKKDDLRRLTRLLNQLDEDKRELLRLRFTANLSFAEIALIEGKTEAAVKMSVYRVLDFLRQEWESENG